MLTTMTGIASNDALRSQAPKAQPFAYTQGTTHRIDLHVINEDGSDCDLGAAIPKLACLLLDGSDHLETFTVDDAASGLAHLVLSPNTVLVPGAYTFQVYLDLAGARDPIVADSVLTVKASAIPTS